MPKLFTFSEKKERERERVNKNKIVGVGGNTKKNENEKQILKDHLEEMANKMIDNWIKNVNKK